MHPNNIFTKLPDASTEEIFETLVRTPGMHIERIVSQGQSTPAGEWFDQPHDEWVLLLAGAARLGYADGESRHLLPGDWLIIPAHCKHRVEWTCPKETSIWLAVHYR